MKIKMQVGPKQDKTNPKMVRGSKKLKKKPAGFIVYFQRRYHTGNLYLVLISQYDQCVIIFPMNFAVFKLFLVV